jgi:hypothetical protein
MAQQNRSDMAPGYSGGAVPDSHRVPFTSNSRIIGRSTTSLPQTVRNLADACGGVHPRCRARRNRGRTSASDFVWTQYSAVDHVGRMIAGVCPRSTADSSVNVMVRWNADEADDTDERGESVRPVHDGSAGRLWPVRARPRIPPGPRSMPLRRLPGSARAHVQLGTGRELSGGALKAQNRVGR